MNKPTVKNISVAEDRKVTVILEYPSLQDVPDEHKILLDALYYEPSWKLDSPGFCLSIRSLNMLSSIGVTTLGQLAERTEYELTSCPNFGARSLKEVKAMLGRFNLSLKK